MVESPGVGSEGDAASSTGEVGPRLPGAVLRRRADIVRTRLWPPTTRHGLVNASPPPSTAPWQPSQSEIGARLLRGAGLPTGEAVRA